MNKLLLLMISIFSTIVIVACDSGPNSPRGFSLPEGDAVNGEKVFMKFQCLSCHNLDGFDLDGVNRVLEPPIQLGGLKTGVRTYGDLVTSVINPSHKFARDYKVPEDGASQMAVFNDVMTVTELVDLVTFLQGKYTVQPFVYTHYGQYQ